MELPPDDWRSDTLPDPAAPPEAALPDMLSDLLGTDGELVPELPEFSDPVELEIDSQPPAPVELNEPVLLTELLAEFGIASGDPEPSAALVDEQLAAEPAEVPEPELLLPPVVEAVEPVQATSAEEPEPPAVPAGPAEAGIEAELEAVSAELSAIAPEPDAQAAPTEPAEAASGPEPEPALEAVEPVLEEAAETPEAMAALPAEPASTALDELIGEIDDETREAFRDQPQVAFESEMPVKEVRGGDSCIVFVLAGTRYAIPIRNVLETDSIPGITLVPNLPAFVRGVTNVRGEIISVIDLRNLFGFERWEFAERGRILIVRTTDQQTAALAVDEVRGTASLSLKELGAPAGPVHDRIMPVLMGVGEHQDQILNVLDVDKLFRTPELRQFSVN